VGLEVEPAIIPSSRQVIASGLESARPFPANLPLAAKSKEPIGLVRAEVRVVGQRGDRAQRFDRWARMTAPVTFKR
jgi:hypothetical protein